MKLYKLTDKNDQTRDDTQWGLGVTHEATGKGKKLCSDGVLHAYRDPLLAVLMDPIHGEFVPDAHLWEAEGKVMVDDGTKVGCKKMTTLRQILLPTITIEQRVRFAILCGKEVCNDSMWLKWADKWLDETDRSAANASAAAYAVYAAGAAAYAAASAAGAAAAYAAGAANASAAAYAAAYAAGAAADYAAYAAGVSSDLVAIAHVAIEG